jgi:hypothetical protein
MPPVENHLCDGGVTELAAARSEFSQGQKIKPCRARKAFPGSNEKAPVDGAFFSRSTPVK